MNKRSDIPFLYEAVFTNVHVGLAIIGGQGLFIDVNEKLFSMFGYNAAELNNCSSLILFSKSFHQQIIVSQHTVLYTGQSAQNESWKLQTKEGSLIDVAVGFNLFTDEKNAPYIIASFVRKLLPGMVVKYMQHRFRDKAAHFGLQ